MKRAACTSVGLMLCSLAGILTPGPQKAQAHDFFTSCIQHRVAVVLGAQHVDVTVQLTFFEEGSGHERKHMDANHDGHLSRSETGAYLQELEPRLAKAVALLVGSRRVTLTPLCAAELDLLGEEHAVRGHHRLTLHYFGPTPSGIVPGAELVVEDRLWPEVRALASIQAEGKDGARLEALPATDPLYPPAMNGEPRTLKARVLVPPAPPLSKGPNQPCDPGPSVPGPGAAGN